MILKCRRQPFGTKRGLQLKNWGERAILKCRRQPFCTKWNSSVKNWGKIAFFFNLLWKCLWVKEPVCGCVKSCVKECLFVKVSVHKGVCVWKCLCKGVCVLFLCLSGVCLCVSGVYLCVCLCVWNIWTNDKLLTSRFTWSFAVEVLLWNLIFWHSRGTWHAIRDHVQRSYLIVWDTEPDQLCVPAFSVPIFAVPFAWRWQPAKPRTGLSIQFRRFQLLHGLRNLVIWVWNFSFSFVPNEHDVVRVSEYLGGLDTIGMIFFEYSLDLCIGIQFPLDDFIDPFPI